MMCPLLGAPRWYRVCQHTSGDVEILTVDFYGAVFNFFHISPMVRVAYDGQDRAAIQCSGLIEKVFIGINGFCNDFVARQFKDFTHNRVSATTRKWTPAEMIIETDCGNVK